MDTRARTNPFPGLRPFMQEEADLFFGRDRQNDELVRRLANRRFLAVVGTSGSGKSSLVRAGLVPSLEGGFMAGAGAHWRMAILRPQDDPVGFLARAIVETGALVHLDIAQPTAAGVVETTLRRSSLGLVEAVRLAGFEPHENLLILVDQFEELFRFADLARQRGAGDEAPAFVKLLLAAAQQTDVPIYVVITMRSDFLGDCARFRDLPEVISDSQYLIPRLTRDELQAVITGPIGVRGGRISASLVQHLLNDVGDDMDQLPVLQHALMRAWDHWECDDPDARSIELSDLIAIGGLAEALSRHADEAYGALTSDRDRTIAERLFKCLTERGSDNREIRRPTPLARISEIADVEAADVVRVVDVFRAPGRSFLMPPHDVALEADSVIDISHESLIRQWGRLRTWVDEEAESRATYLRIVEAARLRRTGRAGLWSEPDLTYARQWQAREAPNATWAERHGPGFDDAGAFLRDSEAAHATEVEQERQRAEAERMAKERELDQAKALAEAQQQRADEQAAASVRQRRFIWMLAVLLAMSVAMAVYAWQQQVAAERQRRLALSRQLAGQATNEIARAPHLAFLLSAAANVVGSSTEAREILQRTLTTQPNLRAFLSGHREPVSAIAFSPDGKTLVSGGDDGAVMFWNVSIGHAVGEPLEGGHGPVIGVAFSPDGHTMAAANGAGSVTLWDVAGRKPLGDPLPVNGVVGVAFSPNGQTIAAASAEGIVRLWDVASRTPLGNPLTTPRVSFGPVLNSVAFSPDRKILAAGGFGTVMLWDVASRTAIGDPLKRHESNVTSIAFSGDGKLLASASADGRLILWDMATREPVTEPLRGRDAFIRLAFSPDGRLLASVNQGDSSVTLWDVARRTELTVPLRGHRDAVKTVAFSSDGKTLASAGDDKVVILWDVPFRWDEPARNPLGEPLARTFSRAFAAAFSPDGKTLASAGDDGMVVVWDVARRIPLGEPLKAHEGAAFCVAFSPDGKTLASGGQDNAVALWDLVTRQPRGRLLEASDDVVSVTFSPDGKTLVASVANRSGQAVAPDTPVVILWDVSGNKPVGEPLRNPQGSVERLAFSPDGATLASAGGDNTVVLWNVEGRKAVGKPFETSPYLSAVVFSPDGKMLASASADSAQATAGLVMIWDVASRKRIGDPLTGHRSFVYDVAFSPDGKTLASAGYDQKVILWDVARRKALGEPLMWDANSVNSIRFSPDGKTLVATSNGREVILWDVDVASWIRKACAVANRNLTHAEWARYVGDDVPYQAPCPELPLPKD